MNITTYEVIKGYAEKETFGGLRPPIPVVVDEERLTDSPLLANSEVRICMADFVDLRRFVVEDDIKSGRVLGL